MEARTRTRERISLPSGRVWYLPNTVYDGFTFTELWWRCDDFIKKTKREDGSTPPSDLVLTKEEIIPIRLNQTKAGTTEIYMRAENVPCQVYGTGFNAPPGGWEYLEGTTAELTAKLLAQTNPFRYEVSVPVMILELLEAASLLKLASANFLTLLGSQHLNYTFGWKQSIQDVRALANITVAIERRIKEFNSLLMSGGLRRRVNLTSGSSADDPSTVPLISNMGLYVEGFKTVHYHTKVWGTVRWKPNRTSPIDISKLASFNQACKIVLDLEVPDASTLWEAIPFSWLVDYFLNVGDTLQALEGTDKVLPYDICIMRERTTTTTIVHKNRPQDNNNDWPGPTRTSMTKGKTVQVVKRRQVVFPSVVGDLLSFGIMSRGQATNLIALLLSLARFKR